MDLIFRMRCSDSFFHTEERNPKRFLIVQRISHTWHVFTMMIIGGGQDMMVI